MEAESSLSASEDGDAEDGDAEDDIRELRARRSVLTNKLAEQQKRRDKIQVWPASPPHQPPPPGPLGAGVGLG